MKKKASAAVESQYQSWNGKCKFDEDEDNKMFEKKYLLFLSQKWNKIVIGSDEMILSQGNK